jgi:hypothetical protein
MVSRERQKIGEVILGFSLQNVAQAFKVPGLVLFFLQFPLALAADAARGVNDYDVLSWSAGQKIGVAIFLIGQLVLLYALLTKNPRFGMLAVGFCALLWAAGMITLLLAGFWSRVNLSPTEVEAVFLAMQWWVFWFLFFHASYL